MKLPHWDLCDTFAYFVMPALFIVGVVILEVKVRRKSKETNAKPGGFEVKPIGEQKAGLPETRKKDGS